MAKSDEEATPLSETRTAEYTNTLELQRLLLPGVN